MYRTLATSSGSSGLYRDFPESSGSGGAFQPAESNADASQPGGLPTVRVNLGCFNCDIDQYMLSKIAHRKSLSRVIAKGVDEQELHILTLSEVGGHKEGLHESTISAQDLITHFLTRHFKAISEQAYMVTWQAEHEPIDDTSLPLWSRNSLSWFSPLLPRSIVTSTDSLYPDP